MCARTGPDVEEASDRHAVYGPDLGYRTRCTGQIYFTIQYLLKTPTVYHTKRQYSDCPL